MRTCIKCGKDKNDEAFYHKPDGRFRGRFCRVCESERCKKRYYKKHDEIRAKSNEYRRKNRDKVRERSREARKKYNHSEYSNKKAKEYRGKISDSYVRVRLRAEGIFDKDLLNDLLDKKKAVIAIERIKKILEQAGLKICDHCNKSLTIDNFYKTQWVWKGEKKYSYANVCKDCSKIRNKRYKKRNRK